MSERRNCMACKHGKRDSATEPCRACIALGNYMLFEPRTK